jgi:hypothetical protein
MIQVIYCVDLYTNFIFTSILFQDRGFEPRPDQTKDYTISICCFFAKQAALRSKNKDLLAQKKDNVSDWSDMSTRGLLF